MEKTAVTNEKQRSGSASFEAFYESARDRVARALALTVGNRELAMEATDEAMSRAFQRWDRIGSYQSPEGWVYRVALNWARSVWRKRRREVSDIYEFGSADDARIDIDLERALAGLDVPFRAVVVLRFYLDWSVDTTAEALGVRPGTVKSRLNRALARLEDELGGDA